MIRKSIRTGLHALLQMARISPSIWELRNPFKIWEYFQIVRGAELNGNQDVLDIGCGKGIQTQALALNSRKVIGIDTGEKQIIQANHLLNHSIVQNRVQYRCVKLEDAGFANESFDRLISFCVLEHITNLNEVLAHAHRILRADGSLHVSVDSLESIQDKTIIEHHRSMHYVFQYFSQDTLRKTLFDAGFEPTAIHPIFVSKFAQEEFTKRVVFNRYGFGLLGRYLRFRKLQREERLSTSPSGIMLVAHAKKR